MKTTILSRQHFLPGLRATSPRPDSLPTWFPQFARRCWGIHSYLRLLGVSLAPFPLIDPRKGKDLAPPVASDSSHRSRFVVNCQTSSNSSSRSSLKDTAGYDYVGNSWFLEPGRLLIVEGGSLSWTERGDQLNHPSLEEANQILLAGETQWITK